MLSRWHHSEPNQHRGNDLIGQGVDTSTGMQTARFCRLDVSANRVRMPDVDPTPPKPNSSKKAA
jgi:hypothetical protein